MAVSGNSRTAPACFAVISLKLDRDNALATVDLRPIHNHFVNQSHHACHTARQLGG